MCSRGKFWFTGGLFFILGLFSGVVLIKTTGGNPVIASPRDVLGSPNIAVDTFRNDAGTFVLWSDGRITKTDDPSSPPKDYGHPYQLPPTDSHIRPPKYIKGKPQGSPNVAVAAVPRSDGTFILFADGYLRQPGSPEGKAPSSTNFRIVKGTIDASGKTLQGSGFTSYKAGGGTYVIRYQTPFKSTPYISILCHKPPSAPNRGVASLPIRDSADSTGFTIRLYDENGHTITMPADTSFDFLAVGQ